MEKEGEKSALILSSERTDPRCSRTAQPRKSELRQFCRTINKLLLSNRTVRIIVLPVIMLMVISNWAELKIPEYAKNFYECFETKDTTLFSRTVLGVVVFTFGHYTIAWLYCSIFHMGLYEIKRVLLCQCTEEYLRIRFEEYQKLGTGRILAHITRQSDAAARFLAIVVKDVGYDMIFFIFCMVSLYSKFGIHFFFIFSMAFLITAVFVAVASFILFRSKSTFNRCENTAFNRAVDIISNYLIIHSYNNTDKEIRAYSSSMNSYVASGRRYEFTLQTFFYFFRVLAFSMHFTVIYSCFVGNLAPNMKGADFLLLQGVFSLYKKRVMALMKINFELISCYADLSSSSSPLGHVGNSKDEQCLWVEKEPAIIFVNTGLFQNNKLLIDCINLEILNGEKVAVTGRNGSGKSTLIKTVIGFGFYSGDILLGDVQISSINEKVLHDKIAYVPQEPHLMNTTVLSNLRYGNKNIDENELVKICKACGVHDAFAGLINGYHTVVGENGCNLSGGQAQLINFMRAVIKDAPIIVLDEPTSNLDYSTSEDLLSLIFGYLSHKTVIFSTHNPHHLSRFDKIININQQRANVYLGYDEFVVACQGRVNL
ncbi:ATP-binding cassette, subfamily B (MDR/TAP), member 7 [Pancytospora epiphaga]|nr:ATP-binding cassette, subfamily B (MDR/TAP), member 7 [Pancytospora epiphaga]